MDSQNGTDIEARLREVRRRLSCLAGPLAERDVNTLDSYSFEAPIPAEAAAPAVVEDDGRFDAFKAVQQRLREKMRALQSAPVGNTEVAAKSLSRDPLSPPPRYPADETAIGPSTVSYSPDIADNGHSVSPPRMECSVDTAAPAPGSRSPVEIEISLHLSDAGDHDEGECDAGRGRPVAPLQPVERQIMGSRKPPMRFKSSPSPAPIRPSHADSAPPAAIAAAPARRTGTVSRSPSSRGSGSAARSRSGKSKTPSVHDPWRAQSARSDSASQPWNDRTSVTTERPRVPPPKPLWAEATVLETVTGAELFAIFRMRGLVTSVGSTEEGRLPPTRCHAVYLTTKEHEQLTTLRELLQHREYARSQQAAIRK